MYDFSSKSQPQNWYSSRLACCLRYCKCTIFQANHNTWSCGIRSSELFAILQMYDFSSKSQRPFQTLNAWPCCLRYCKCTIFQANHNQQQLVNLRAEVVCDTANVRFFKQITTVEHQLTIRNMLFAILQMYDFSSKSQPMIWLTSLMKSCLRYCKCTIFQANHNMPISNPNLTLVVCDTANVRFFKQITTMLVTLWLKVLLFAILQMYDFSSKVQHRGQ